MAQGDPAGWESLGANDPTLYRATFSYNRVQGSGQIKQRVKAIANRSNGNYDVYTTAFGSPDQLIYSYNASNDKTTVSNTGIYNQIFTGPRIQQLTNLNSGVRKATLQLAENNVSGGPNSISSRDLQQLKNSTGYKSLGNAVAAPTPDPPLAPGPGADPITGPDPDPQTNIEPFSGAELTTYTDKQRLFADNKAILKYPLNQSSEVYDYIRIQPVEYVAGFNIGQTPTAQIESVTTRIKNTGIYPTIFLPMTPSISETNSVGWGADELNPVQIAFGQAAMNAIGSAADGNISLDDIKNALSGIAGAAINLTNQAGLSKFISAYFAGQAVSANLLGRTGIVINPNLELLFQGPKLRSFRYNFRFTPRDDKEAKEIRRIIRVFKKSMAVRRTKESLFLGVPAVYEIKYIFKGNRDHPFLNKIKPCALTGFNVNYAPDGSYMTYQDGSMTSYTVDMQFDEIEPIYNEDIDDIYGPTTGY